MILTTLLLAAPAAAAPAPTPDLLAIQVGRAETVDQGTLEHAVILVEDGKIVMIGEDLPIERGIPVLDRDPEWTVMPGMVNAYSRGPLDSRGGNDSSPGKRASDELYTDEELYGELLELGVTTLGLYPAGNGIPGRAVAGRTHGATPEEMILQDDVYLKVIMDSNGRSKKMIRDGFEEADEWIEEEKEAREEYEEEKEKREKRKKKKDDDDEEEEEELGPYRAPEKKPEAEAFLQLRERELRALISIREASDYLHLLDAIGDEEFDWDLRIPVSTELNVFQIKNEIGSAGRRVVMEPQMSRHPNTLRLRNVPQELHAAGAKLVFVPRSDSENAHEEWRGHAGELVRYGLDRDVALRALTLEPAEMMGLGERLGSITPGKDANLVFLDGDPLEPGTKVTAVMLEGDFVSGEVQL